MLGRRRYIYIWEWVRWSICLASVFRPGRPVKMMMSLLLESCTASQSGKNKNGKKFVRNSLYSPHFFPLVPLLLLLVLFFRPIDSDVQRFLSRPLLAPSKRPVK